jgi:NitT/TauT family transport system substrate-binding protein
MTNVLSRSAAIAGALAAAACPRFAQAQTTTLKAAGVLEDSISSLLVARDQGLFRRYGLAVDLSPERSGSAIASGVAGGAFAIAKSSVVGLIVARSKGIPFTLVAPGGISDVQQPITGMLVKSTSRFKDAASLNGGTIAVSALNDIYSLATREWMRKTGGDPDSIKQLEFPFAAVPEAIAQGRIDAGCVVEPVLAQATSAGGTRVIGHPFDAIAPRFMYTAWFALEPWVATHASDAVAFAKAVQEGARYANTHRPQTATLLAQTTSIDAGIIARMTRVECGTMLDPALLQPLVDLCARYKLLAQPFDARDMIAPPVRTL